MGKPVLLSVDDDPGVSRAVARDLRRKYGEEHRVLRASSGPEALVALRELKLRGDTVVALLAATTPQLATINTYLLTEGVFTFFLLASTWTSIRAPAGSTGPTAATTR